MCHSTQNFKLETTCGRRACRVPPRAFNDASPIITVVTGSSTSYVIPQRAPHRLPRNKHFTYSPPMVGPPHPRAFETLLYRQARRGKINWHLINPKLLKRIRSGYLGGLTRAFFGKHLDRLILGNLLSRKNSPYKLPRLSKEEKAKRGRQAQQVPTFRTGLDLSVGVGPSLAAMNFSFYRHHSVVPGSWVDWRLFMTTPVQTQYGVSGREPGELRLQVEGRSRDPIPRVVEQSPQA